MRVAASVVAAALLTAASPVVGRDALTFDLPESGVVGEALAFVSGRAVVQTDLDVVIAIDVSRSLAGALNAELAAAHALLERLDPDSARVGVVAFAGDVAPRTPDAWLLAPLAHDFEAARRAVAAIRQRGARGATNLLAGLERARVELLGMPGATSRPRRGALRVVALLTDASDVHPLRPDPAEATELLRRELAAAAAAGIDVQVTRVGDAALAPLVDLLCPCGFEGIDGAGLADLELGHAAGPPALVLERRPGGRFAGLVRLQPGRNVLVARARARDGSTLRRELVVEFRPGAAPAPLGPAQLAWRGALLERHLLSLYRPPARRLERSLEIAAE